MTPQEQKAFVEAYENNCNDMPKEYVADFVARYKAGENIPNGEGYTSIMDALGMWHDAIAWNLKQQSLKKLEQLA